jgi:aminoglycoside phosphotransferase (APT) family kinase protein
VGTLTEGATGRYDAAVADLDDGRRVVVRVPADDSTAPELAAEVRALRALTPGVRGLLPFRAPELLGEAGIGESRAVVVDFLPGYRVDAAHLPPGRGAATSLGASLAALHALPLSIVRTEGLPVRTPQQVRTDTGRVVDRAEATRRAPKTLLERWRRAIAADELWRFESAVVLGGAGAASFLFDDVDGVPQVTGLLEWHGLSVGDPATDLQWLASAPAAADDVYAAYVANSGRAPDARARERARLYAELEFAKWLIHGHESGRRDVMDDAVGLLESLSAGVAGDDIVTDAALDVDDAIALLDRMPDATPAAGDTSMQTDAYDPEELSLWVTTEPEREPEPVAAVEVTASDVDVETAAEPLTGNFAEDDASTAPIDISAIIARGDDGSGHDGSGHDGSVHDGVGDEDAAQAEALRASDAALRRWRAD